jgi:hypothetical protein
LAERRQRYKKETHFFPTDAARNASFSCQTDWERDFRYLNSTQLRLVKHAPSHPDVEAYLQRPRARLQLKVFGEFDRRFL